MNPTRNLPPHYPAGVVMALAVLAAVAAFASKACRKLAQIARAYARPFDVPDLARHMLLGAIFGAALGLAQVGTGCVDGKLTPVAATVLDGAFAALCTAESAIPVVGAEAVAFCPAEDAAVVAAVKADTAMPAPAATPSPAAPVATTAAARTVPLMRLGVSGALVHCAWATPAAAPAAQRRLLASGAKGLPAAAPVAPAALPPRVLPLADAGADGGGK